MKALRIDVPLAALKFEERRLDALLDPIDPDLSAWDAERSLEPSRSTDVRDRLRGLDWTRRCLCREPHRHDIARRYAEELLALRFPWTALVALEQVFAAAVARRSAEVGLIDVVVRGSIEAGCPAAGAAILARLRRPISPKLAEVEAMLGDAGTNGTRVVAFPGPALREAAAGAASVEPMDAFRMWLEADATGQTIMASGLMARALRDPLCPRASWAPYLASTFGGVAQAWPSREHCERIVRHVASRPDLSPQAAALQAAQVISHLAAIHKGEPVASAAMIGALGAGAALPMRIDVGLACCEHETLRLHERPPVTSAQRVHPDFSRSR